MRYLSSLFLFALWLARMTVTGFVTYFTACRTVSHDQFCTFFGFKLLTAPANSFVEVREHAGPLRKLGVLLFSFNFLRLYFVFSSVVLLVFPGLYVFGPVHWLPVSNAIVGVFTAIVVFCVYLDELAKSNRRASYHDRIPGRPLHTAWMLAWGVFDGIASGVEWALTESGLKPFRMIVSLEREHWAQPTVDPESTEGGVTIAPTGLDGEIYIVDEEVDV